MARRRVRSMTVREIGVTILLFLAIIWLSFLVVGIFHKEQVARLTVTDTRSQLAALDARKKSLSDTVTTLGTDRGEEASLRETFGVAKPGEDVIVVVPKKDMPPPPEPTFWDKVKDFFGV